MAAYRFCRTDDIGLLVDALNRCWAPWFPGEPPMCAAAFKRSIRDNQVWCSSCMVAFANTEPIGVLIGAKRPAATLVHRIAVHPEHRRRGHGRHLLESLSSKLAILGPPRIVAEVPETLAGASDFFAASGYVRDAVLTDYVRNDDGDEALAGDGRQRIVVPVSVDDLAANGLLDAVDPHTCWERAPDALTARKADITGLAVASDDRIEAFLLHVGAEIVALRSLVDDGAKRLKTLLSRLSRLGTPRTRFSKVHEREIPHALLVAVGFRAVGRHVVHAARAR